MIRARNEDFSQLIESASRAVRNVMYELRPPMLDEYGLVASLQWYAKEFTLRTGIHAEIRGVEGRRLGPAVEIALFRIAQEALNNVAKHAGASGASIHLRRRANGLDLHLIDNGRGFDPTTTPPGHLGLGIMHERARAIGARLRIVSRLGDGTQVHVRWRGSPA